MMSLSMGRYPSSRVSRANGLTAFELGNDLVTLHVFRLTEALACVLSGEKLRVARRTADQSG